MVLVAGGSAGRGAGGGAGSAGGGAGGFRAGGSAQRPGEKSVGAARIQVKSPSVCVSCCGCCCWSGLGKTLLSIRP